MPRTKTTAKRERDQKPPVTPRRVNNKKVTRVKKSKLSVDAIQAQMQALQAMLHKAQAPKCKVVKKKTGKVDKIAERTRLIPDIKLIDWKDVSCCTQNASGCDCFASDLRMFCVCVALDLGSFCVGILSV